MQLVLLTSAMIADKSPTNFAPDLALNDVKAFYDERPDCGTMEQAIQLVQNGVYKLGCYLDERGAYCGMTLLTQAGDTIHVEAHKGKLSDYTACALALEAWARQNTAANYIQTDTKPSYAVVNGKLGYELASFKWRKQIREE